MQSRVQTILAIGQVPSPPRQAWGRLADRPSGKRYKFSLYFPSPRIAEFSATPPPRFQDSTCAPAPMPVWCSVPSQAAPSAPGPAPRAAFTWPALVPAGPLPSPGPPDRPQAPGRRVRWLSDWGAGLAAGQGRLWLSAGGRRRGAGHRAGQRPWPPTKRVALCAMATAFPRRAGQAAPGAARTSPPTVAARAGRARSRGHAHSGRLGAPGAVFASRCAGPPGPRAPAAQGRSQCSRVSPEGECT